MRERVAIAAFVAGALLGACGDDGGGGAEGAAGGNGGEGCDVVGADDAAEAVGTAVEGATAVPAGCQYAVDPELGSYYQWQTVPVSTYEENRSIAAESSGSFSVEDVAGLGDEAFRRNGLGGDGSVISTDLWILVGDEAVFVSAGLIDIADAGPAQEALAALVVDRVG